MHLCDKKSVEEKEVHSYLYTVYTYVRDELCKMAEEMQRKRKRNLPQVKSEISKLQIDCNPIGKYDTEILIWPLFR